jgi:gamma-glutamyltranspeptidase / glutathione hydrolase
MRLTRTSNRRGAPILLGLVGLCAALTLAAPRVSSQAAGTAAAATENELATREALEQMRAGGNAADAAVTAALVAGVASPTSSGIGGGGFVLAWLADKQQPYLLDFRETAPQKTDPAWFEKRPLPAAERGKLVGVPGEVAGLFEFHRRHGKRKWSDLVAPAARWAKNGFPVNRHLGQMLDGNAAGLKVDPGILGVYFPNGKPAAVGKLIRNPKLGATLDRIAAEGPAAFYEGSVARDLVSAAQAAGSPLTADELKAYRPVERKPLHSAWEGHDIYTMPPPSAGGLMLAQTLALLSSSELKALGKDSGAYQHVVAEALRSAIADRMRFVSDPDRQVVDVPRLLDAKRLAERKRTIALNRTHAAPRFGLEGGGTHHLVTADRAGNVVSLTTTVNRLFGAKITGAESGVVLNDQLDDFTESKAVAPFGLKESPNRARPLARPVSSMTPTIVVRAGRPVLAIGGSGGPTIATNVTQLTLSRLVFGTKPSDLVKGQRFYVPTSGSTILLEAAAPPALKADLESRGEVVGKMPFTGSAVQLIALENGRKFPASDPRKHGSARAE